LTSAAFLATGASAAAAASARDPIRMFDTDADGTLDLTEVKKAASTLFAKLDPDHDGTLDKRELAGRLSARELAAADPDHDGTPTLDEYLAVVEKRSMRRIRTATERSTQKSCARRQDARCCVC
jgi:hypothetical protein